MESTFRVTGGVSTLMESTFRLTGGVSTTMESTFRLTGDLSTTMETTFRLTDDVSTTMESTFRLTGALYRHSELVSESAYVITWMLKQVQHDKKNKSAVFAVTHADERFYKVLQTPFRLPDGLCKTL